MFGSVPVFSQKHKNGYCFPLTAVSFKTMVDCLRQLWLLTRKNLILTWRSKVWTLFELVLPVLIMLPVTILIAKTGTVALSPGHSFDAVPIKGDASDIPRKIGFVTSIQTHWCNHRKVSLAYHAHNGIDEADKLMNELEVRFSDKSFKVDVNVLKMDDEKSMIDQLRADAPNNSMFGCAINRFVGGVIFDRLNTTERKLDYRILLPTGIADYDWYLGREWSNPFGVDIDYNKIPALPPYWSSAFLSLQYAVDSIFIKISTSVLPGEVRLRRLPEATYNLNSVAAFLSSSSYLFGLSAFVLVIHTARQLANERSTVKEFLSVMGLSTPMFYLSHILYASFKSLIVFVICCIPLIPTIAPVSVSLFLVTVVLYGISATVFAALISSLFKSPNTVLKVTIIIWILLVALPHRSPPVDQIFLCALSCLNPNAAFSYALKSMSDYMNRDRTLSWLNMFEGASFHFAVGAALLMMLFDILWMFMATLLMDLLFSDSDFSFFKLPFARGYLQSPSTRLNTVCDNNETDEGLLQTKAGIRVQQLIKVWSSTGERAVDEMSLEAYVGQVTVLLGHNGAGKSTTFSMICGLIAPTSGSVLVRDFDIEKQRTLCRRYIGLCPQGNALFDRLTVNEHLWLIHGLKGATGSYMSEGRQLLNQLKLSDKSKELAMNLSGGQKRKLCVSMAIIGNSTVILLDEPTAGMDPCARRDVESLIQSIKVDRTVLLTTHYMDEAELLGDRVAIMARGRVYCCGTPQFLKKRFGTGYVMTVVVTEDANAQEIAGTVLQIAKKYVKDASKENVHGKQFEIILPKEEQKNFPVLFKHLEKAKDELKISSFGLSLNTLEQVFLKVAEKADPCYVDASISRCIELIKAQQTDRLRGIPLLFAQVCALFIKRILYNVRNWTHLLTQLVVPLGILILIAYLSKMTWRLDYDQERSYSLSTFGPSRIPVKIVKKSSVSRAYLDLCLAQPGSVVSELNENANLSIWVEQLPKQLPAAGLGAVFEENVTELLFSSRAYHSLPSCLNLFSNARLKANAPGGNVGIRTRLYAYVPYIIASNSSSGLISTEFVDVMIGPFIVLALALLTSAFIKFLVEERVSKFAHQQMLTGISPITFWATSLLHDFLFFSVVCSCFLIVFIVSGWMQGYLNFVILLLVLYFWSCVPFVYAVSFLFSSPSKAIVILFLWQLVAAFAAMLVMTIISHAVTLDPTIADILRSILLFVLPSFAFGNAIMTVGTSSASKIPPQMLWEWNMLGKNMTLMLIFGCFSAMLFVLFQFKSVRYCWHQVWDLRFGRKDYGAVDRDEEDSDVRRERISVQQHGDDLALEVKDLCKMYGHLTAVDGLTMGVRNGECFGLLGVNGAGKTTTFDILTGQSFATAGTAYIDKRDVTEQIPIGYCPQFDALMLDFTGRESLKLIARMHGFLNVDEFVELALQNVGMVDHADKLVRYYSGGQRRKISVALAVLSSTRIIILDEPTAGIDPKARREIWEVLSTVRDQSRCALLLTSHSMDECEALCSRIAILQKGRMVAIGTSQHLKTKFGNSYTITMVSPNLERRGVVIDGVVKAFPNAMLKTPKEGLSLSLKWQIPKSSSDQWSSLFRDVQSLANSLGVVDFCVTQSSLEETFLHVSLFNEEQDDSA